MKKKIIFDDVFLVEVTAIAGTREEAQKFLDKCGIKKTLTGQGYCGAMPDNKGLVVWLMHPDDFYVLLHECVHLVRIAFGDKGINTELQNEDETFAYYQCYWFKKLWRFYGKLTTTPKK